jgi:hypothetical protein
MFDSGRTYDHTITLPGRTARSEAVVVFNLHDLLEVSPGLEGAESVKQKIAELEAKAAAQRAEIAKNKDAGTETD